MSGWRLASLTFEGNWVSKEPERICGSEPLSSAVRTSKIQICHHNRRLISTSNGDKSSFRPSRCRLFRYAILIATSINRLVSGPCLSHLPQTYQGNGEPR